MSAESKIEWTDSTWNPVRGCTKISPGCAHCYAETFAERFRGVPGHPYEQGFDLRLVPEKLTDPITWAKPKMIFVNSMSDLFHKEVADDYILSVVKVMQVANWHTYQVLSKRSERMRDLLSTKLKDAASLPHIWWGVSVENKKHGLPRIEHLRQAPAAVRFLSIEPLLEDLGPINLDGISWVPVPGRWRKNGCCRSEINASRPRCRSSSSNGAAGTRKRLAAFLMAAPTTRCLPGRAIRCRARRNG